MANQNFNTFGRVGAADQATFDAGLRAHMIRVYNYMASGVLLTGMGYDGAAGFAEIKRRGGSTIAESEETAVVYGMPKELVQRKGASLVLPLNKIAAQVKTWVART